MQPQLVVLLKLKVNFQSQPLNKKILKKKKKKKNNEKVKNL